MTATDHRIYAVVDRLTSIVDGQLVAVSIEYVGPAEAELGLAMNTNNRNLRQRLLGQLMRDFSSGNYVFSGSPIVYSDDGVLVDGQHRLTAILQTGVTVPMLVVRGVKAKAQSTIDTGAKRTFGDVLTLKGYERGKDLAALVRAAYLWQKGHYTATSFETPTNTELLAFLDANDDLIGCIEVVEPSVRKWKMVRSKASLACWLFQRVDPVENAAFWSLMPIAEGDSGTPIGALQARYHREMVAAKQVNRMNPEYELALIIKAWNAYIRGERVVHLKWRSGGSSAEKFPQPIGPID